MHARPNPSPPDQLGIIPPLLIPAMFYLLGGAAVGTGAAVMWSLRGDVKQSTRVVIWGGAAWALYQLYKRR